MIQTAAFTSPTGLRFAMWLATAAFALQPLSVAAGGVAKVPRQLISSIGSERATSGNGNKIVTSDGKTHIVWQDANMEGYFARIRTLDHKTREWSPTYTIGKGKDNHAWPHIRIERHHSTRSGPRNPAAHPGETHRLQRHRCRQTSVAAVFRRSFAVPKTRRDHSERRLLCAAALNDANHHSGRIKTIRDLS